MSICRYEALHEVRWSITQLTTQVERLNLLDQLYESDRPRRKTKRRYRKSSSFSNWNFNEVVGKH